MKQSRNLLAALSLILLLAYILSPYASSLPDGLQHFALKQGFAQAEHTLWRAPFSGLLSERSGRSLAALIGTCIAFLISFGIANFLSKKRSRVD